MDLELDLGSPYDSRYLMELVGGDVALYRDLFDSFLVDLRGILAALRAAVAEGQVAEIARMAHTLKGLAGNVGATRVRLLGQRLEAATERVDDATWEHLVGVLEGEIRCLEAAPIS